VQCISIKYVYKETGASYFISDLVVFTDFKEHSLVPTQIWKILKDSI